MERVGDEVDRALARFGPQGAMGAVVAAWPGAVGPEIARNAWPARISRHGILHVNTSSSAWAQELTQLGSTVLERLGERLGTATPSCLRFAPGPLPEGAPEAAQSHRRRPATPGDEDRAEAARLAAAVDDPELRQRVAAAIAQSLVRLRDDRRV